MGLVSALIKWYPQFYKLGYKAVGGRRIYNGEKDGELPLRTGSS
jgi:hypothetical protein